MAAYGRSDSGDIFIGDRLDRSRHHRDAAPSRLRHTGRVGSGARLVRLDPVPPVLTWLQEIVCMSLRRTLVDNRMNGEGQQIVNDQFPTSFRLRPSNGPPS
jgi:hypothetical protein